MCLKFDIVVLTLMSEAFAVVREAARRKLGMRHFDVQVCHPLIVFWLLGGGIVFESMQI